MEANKNLFWNKAMFWGFILALTSMIITTVYYSTDNMLSKSKTWVDLSVYIIVIIAATIAYKNTLADKDLFPYSKALGFGVATAFFASLILAVFTFVLFKYIDPDLNDLLLVEVEEKLIEAGLSDDMIEQQMDMQRNFSSPAIKSIASVFGTVFQGLLISLITSIFMRKKIVDGFEAAMNDIEDDE
ncbi:MAG: DUF4199 domain-containing protein [Prolixibacteraceae bacterium]|jgi:membrane protease YdiL (CAAX protease family)|nr:DUF4199 domain-containing protein [Prolixibacteraceae bacterium]